MATAAPSESGTRITIGLDRYDEAIIIGFRGNATEVIVKPRSDKTVNKTMLLTTLKRLVRKLEAGPRRADLSPSTL
jgi:hypothetical protein